MFFCPLVCTAKVDLDFLIDGSGSIERAGPGNFKRELNFVKQIVKGFEVSKEGTHVGVIIFSSGARVCFGKLIELRMFHIFLVFSSSLGTR